MMSGSLKILALFLLVLPAGTGRVDEGQWLPEQFLAMDWDALRERGLELSRDEFWHPEKGGVLSAAVQINGCSASFVSADGLVVTNHHCGYGAINRLSTVETNHLADGFVAMERGDELPAAGVTVFVLKGIEDVTEQVHTAMEAAPNDVERYRIEQSTIAQLVRQAERSEPNVSARVSSFLEGQKYMLFRRTMLTDVRLVYAPPAAVGEFGGDVDNWEWPRHTGDFCFFRAYVSPDGKPAAYSPDNVPFKPDHFLKVAEKGVSEGDLVMILGYPGRTERYLTSVAVQSREQNYFPLRLDVLTDIIAVLKKAGEGKPEKALAMASRIKSLANRQKNAEGMVWGLDRNAVVERKKREEAAFRAWMAEDADARKGYAEAYEQLVALDEEQARFESHDELLLQLWSNAPFTQRAIQLMRGVLESDKPEAERRSGFSDRQLQRLRRGLRQKPDTTDLQSIEEPVLAIVLAKARELPADTPLGNVVELMAESNPEEFAKMAVRGTNLADPEVVDALFKDGLESARQSSDPMVRMALGLAESLNDYLNRRDTQQGRRLQVGRTWIEAQQEWRGKSFYPDANSTLRVSVASVKGYAPRDGVFHVPHTTLAGVVAKETGEEPFASPAALLEAAKSSSESRYYDAELGDVPVCFLSDGDTTGGNSGSCVVNGRGELVGLNFDRVFENVSGDYGWNVDRSRNISVDVRYVLWNLESVLPAPHLLAEMGHGSK